MKKKFNSIAILLITAVFGLSSCLKESKYYVNVSQGAPLAELPLASFNGGAGNLVPEALAISATPTVLPTVVNIASVSPLSTATSITLELDPASLSAFDAAIEGPYKAASLADVAAGTTPPPPPTLYSMLPAADYSVASWTVVVPAGQHTATLNININTSLVNPSGNFVLPIKIASASGLTIDQYNGLLYNISAKNQYDGVYVVTGTLTDNTTAAITGSYPETVQLQTQGANSDAFYDPNIGFFHSIDAGASYYSSFAPVFTFSGNNVTAVTNYYGQFSGSHLRSAVLDPNGVNKFTSGSPGQSGSVFQVTYDMQQGNPGVTRTIFVETFTYQGSR
jgi:hypothetical protein